MKSRLQPILRAPKGLQGLTGFQPGTAGGIRLTLAQATRTIAVADSREVRSTMQRPSIAILGLLAPAVVAVLVACGSGSAPSGTVRYGLDDADAVLGEETKWTFDSDATGGVPNPSEEFSGSWRVRGEADAPTSPNALCQTETAEFPALSLGNLIFANVTVSVQFKPISGETDQAAGIILRVQDSDNYYIVRANALEDNVNIYKYANGQRSLIASGDAEVQSGQWQELSVEVRAERIEAFLSGTPVVEAEDSEYPAGKIGLWTKADSVTCFDDVAATAE